MELSSLDMSYLEGFETSLRSDYKHIRKSGLDRLNERLFESDLIWTQSELIEIWEKVKKPLRKSLTDSVEYCRSLSVDLWKKFLNVLPENDENIVYLIPILWRRLSFLEQQEPSEEVRLNYVSLLRIVVDKYKKNLPVYSDDLVAIFARTVTDNYPEVKRESCACIEELASSIPVQFYPKSESLVKPILSNFNHQHYKVRVASVKAIGKVLLHGNSKAMEEVSTPMAQRLFDQSGAVRLAVVEVAGLWFLELRDRYSWWHKLIPLLVTGLHDEIKDIRIRAGQLWDEAGKLYLQENENDERLKDKMDFLTQNKPHHYPHQSEKFRRPNLGCRIIIQQNLCKLLSGITRELGDWLVDIRVRTAQLLCVLVLNAEQDITQYFEQLLPAMCRACNDEDPRVVQNVEIAAEYMGYFVLPSIYCSVILPFDRNVTAGHLQVFAGILRGSESKSLSPELPKIMENLRDFDLLMTKKPKLQKQLLNCCRSIIRAYDDENSSCIFDDLFVILFTLFATCQEKTSIDEAKDLLACLVLEIERMSTEEFYMCIRLILQVLKDDCECWTIHSSEFNIFRCCLTHVPAATAQHPDLVLPILKTTMSDKADPELRLKFFILLAEYFSYVPQEDSLHLYKITQLGHPILMDIIIPALVWTAGRTAESIRTAAVCCLCALFDEGPKSSGKKNEDQKGNEENSKDSICGLFTEGPKSSGKKNEDQKGNEENSKDSICGLFTEGPKKSGNKSEVPKENEEISMDYDPIIEQVKKYSLHDFGKIMPILVTLVDDNAKKTRLYALRAIFLVFKVGKKLSLFNEEEIHATYPAVLKRLDDGCDDVRAAAAETLVEVWRVLPENYDLVFSRSHVDYLYTTAIVHLDDPDSKFQALMLDALLELSKIHPQLLATKIENCRGNFRNRAGLDRVLNNCHELLRSST